MNECINVNTQINEKITYSRMRASSSLVGTIRNCKYLVFTACPPQWQQSHQHRVLKIKFNIYSGFLAHHPLGLLAQLALECSQGFLYGPSDFQLHMCYR